MHNCTDIAKWFAQNNMTSECQEIVIGWMQPRLNNDVGEDIAHLGTCVVELLLRICHRNWSVTLTVLLFTMSLIWWLFCECHFLTLKSTSSLSAQQQLLALSKKTTTRFSWSHIRNAIKNVWFCWTVPSSFLGFNFQTQQATWQKRKSHAMPFSIVAWWERNSCCRLSETNCLMSRDKLETRSVSLLLWICQKFTNLQWLAPWWMIYGWAHPNLWPCVLFFKIIMLTKMDQVRVKRNFRHTSDRLGSKCAERIEFDSQHSALHHGSSCYGSSDR